MIEAGPRETGEWTARRVVLTTLGALGVAFGFWLWFRFYSLAFILFTALVLSTAIHPAVDWLHRLRVPRSAGVILVYLALLALVVGFVWLLAPILIAQTANLLARVPEYYHDLRAWMSGASGALLRRMVQRMPANLDLTLPLVGNGPLAPEAVGQALGYLGAVWKTIFTAAAILVLAFYWTLDGRRTVEALLQLVPSPRRPIWRGLVSEMQTKVGAYIRGVLIFSFAVGALSGIFYLALGLPSPLVLGLLTAIFQVVPVLGPVLGVIPAVLLALTSSPGKVLWVILASIVIQQAGGNVIMPRVMDRTVGVNPFVTILALSGFGALFGLPGALLAIPLAALIQIILDYTLFHPAAAAVAAGSAPAGQPAGPGCALAGAAQDLLQQARGQMRRQEGGPAGQAGGDVDIERLVEAAALELAGFLAARGEARGNGGMAGSRPAGLNGRGAP